MRRSSKFVVPGLLSLFTACQGVEPELPASAHSQVSELAATATGLTATVSTSSSWEGGFSGVAVIKNTTSSPITEWALTVKFNGAAGIVGSPWGAGGSATKNSDGSWTVQPNTWGGNVVPANGSVTVSFDGGGTYSGVASCSINGYACSGGTNSTDKTPPTVSLTATPTQVMTAGSVSLTAPATDNVGVSRVEFYKNGVIFSTDSTSPFTASDAFSNSGQNGTYSYTAKAYDAAGNSATSSGVSVQVNLPGTPPRPRLPAGACTSGTPARGTRASMT